MQRQRLHQPTQQRPLKLLRANRGWSCRRGRAAMRSASTRDGATRRTRTRTRLPAVACAASRWRIVRVLLLPAAAVIAPAPALPAGNALDSSPCIADPWRRRRGCCCCGRVRLCVCSRLSAALAGWPRAQQRTRNSATLCTTHTHTATQQHRAERVKSAVLSSPCLASLLFSSDDTTTSRGHATASREWGGNMQPVAACKPRRFSNQPCQRRAQRTGREERHKTQRGRGVVRLSIRCM